MKRPHSLVLLFLSVFVGLGSASAQTPVPTAPRSPNDTLPTIQTTPRSTTDAVPDRPAVPAVQPTPAVTTSVGPNAPDPRDGKEPKAATVKETEPVVPPKGPTPAPETPVLSAPAPSPEVLPVLPKTRYFVLVFSSESVPKRGRFTHTWMTIVKATPKPNLVDPYDPAGDQTKYYDLLAHTISWMPASMRIRVLKLRSEPGVNLDLHTTLRYTSNMCERIALWGPYELNPTIAEGVYNKAVKQIAKLKSGCVQYKSLDPDSGPRVGWVVDCIHAVSDLDGTARRMRYDEFRYNGWDGGWAIARSLVGSNRVDPTVEHAWVANALKLNCYRICLQHMLPCRPMIAAE